MVTILNQLLEEFRFKALMNTHLTLLESDEWSDSFSLFKFSLKSSSNSIKALALSTNINSPRDKANKTLCRLFKRKWLFSQ
jgi:hypothetical protein